MRYKSVKGEFPIAFNLFEKGNLLITPGYFFTFYFSGPDVITNQPGCIPGNFDKNVFLSVFGCLP